MSDLILNSKSFNRGNVWYVDLGEGKVGSEQGGKRPAVIVSNDMNNKYSSVVNVVLATARSNKNNLPVHVKAYLHRESYFLCEQIITVSKSRLVNHVGQLSKAKMSEVEKGMLMQLQLA